MHNNERPALFRRVSHRGLWLIGALVAAEALILFSTASSNPAPATGFSLAVAVFVLTSGVLPALLLPNIQSVLAACFAIVLASVLVLPFDPLWLSSLFLPIDTTLLPRALIVRLINAALLGPIALHFVAQLGRYRIANRVLVVCYSLTATLILFMLLIPDRRLHNGGALLLVLWTSGHFATALGLLVAVSRDLAADHRRAAQQARLLLIGVLLAELPLLLRPIVTRIGFDPPYNLLLAIQLILPLTIAYAISQHDLFGVDAVLRRALAAAAVSVVVLVVYFGLTLGLTTALIRIMPQFRGIATVIGLFAAALVFGPARQRAQYMIDQLFYPERLSFQNEIGVAQTQLAQVVERDAIIYLLTHDLPPRLGATWAWLGLAADAPSLPPSGQASGWNTDLTVGGRSLGRYVLGPRTTGLPYAADEQAQLQALAQQAALSLAYAAVFDALAALNRDLEQQVATRTEQVLDQQRALAVVAERQRLARDMHDSVTQTLFSINLGARALRQLLQRDANAALVALEEQERAAQQALAEMRSLLVQLRSPLLADGDLVAALRHHCELLRQHYGLEVTLAMPAHGVIAAPLTEALLHIAKEALHNVVKHSGVPQAHLMLACEPAAIVLEIRDSGCGFDLASAGSHTSFGLRGIRERVAALDGNLEIIAAPGAGTLVRVSVPMEASMHD